MARLSSLKAKAKRLPPDLYVPRNCDHCGKPQVNRAFWQAFDMTACSWACLNAEDVANGEEFFNALYKNVGANGANEFDSYACGEDGTYV